MLLRKLYVYMRRLTITAVLLCIATSLFLGLYFGSTRFIVYGILWLVVLLLVLHYFD